MLLAMKDWQPIGEVATRLLELPGRDRSCVPGFHSIDHEPLARREVDNVIRFPARPARHSFDKNRSELAARSWRW